MGRRGATVVLLAGSALLACRFLLLLAVIPPWQQPDEPTHVAVVERHKNRAASADGSPNSGREGEILPSMLRYRWWEHRGFEVPTVLPQTFDPRVGVPSEGFTKPPTYSLIAGPFLGWFAPRSVVEDLYLLRAISAVLGMCTLWIAWLGARECFGALGGATVTVLLALHPQFAIVSTSASPDPMVNFLGACMWWQAAAAVNRRHVLLPLAAVWAAAIAAAAADRMGVALVPVALCLSAVVIALRARLWGRWAAFAIPAAAVVGVVLLGAAAAMLNAFGETYGMRRIFSGGWAPVPGAMTWSSFIRFTELLHQSWWFSLGWGRYPPPEWWATLAGVLTLVAALGAGRRLFSKQIDPRTRMVLALAVIGIGIQLFGVYWTFFRLGNGAQGRYLFPVIVPSLVLLWGGIEAWVPQSQRLYAATALVLLFAVLDAAAWTLVAIPTYYASL